MKDLSTKECEYCLQAETVKKQTNLFEKNVNAKVNFDLNLPPTHFHVQLCVEKTLMKAFMPLCKSIFINVHTCTMKRQSNTKNLSTAQQ